MSRDDTNPLTPKRWRGGGACPALRHCASVRGGAGPTGQVSIRTVRPANTTGVLPVVFHSHGGGWILGDKDTHERPDRELANQAQAVIVFVDYTPAPDAHYPVQNEQAYTALEWAIANAAQICADPTRVAAKRHEGSFG